ncbi:MAG: metallophosphoesterase family protein [Vulcanimicrobiaceae bacterium]
MSYAFLSDIHGNLESLQHALALVRPEERIICLGDTVGYGPNPNECLRLVRERAMHVVLGNHDIAAVENFGVEYFNDAARAAIEWTQTVIEEDLRTWLNSLSYELRLPEYLFVHGAPVKYFEYILDKASAARAFQNTDARAIFIGHTHIAEWYSLAPDGAIGHRHMQYGGTLHLEPGMRYIIDVGSVGQPRDLNPHPCFVRFNPQTEAVEWIRYEYPIFAVQEKMHECHLPEALSVRLEMGR